MHHTSCRVFWQNIKSLRWLSPTTTQIWCPLLLVFPKSKITFERKEISDCQWNLVKYDRAADDNWENCMRSQVSTLKVTEVSLSYVQCFLYLLQKMSVFFILHGRIPSGQTPLCEETQSTNSKEFMHIYIYFSAIYNNQDFEATQVSICRCVNKKFWYWIQWNSS